MTNGIEVKKAPVGYSWTMLFWWFFVPLLRADWVWFVAMLALGLLFWWVPAIVMSFFYNKIYLKNLFNKGYKVHSQTTLSDQQIMNYTGIINVPRHQG
jgi:hypothetical protein